MGYKKVLGIGLASAALFAGGYQTREAGVEEGPKGTPVEIISGQAKLIARDCGETALSDARKAKELELPTDMPVGEGIKSINDKLKIATEACFDENVGKPVQDVKSEMEAPSVGLDLKVSE